MTRKKICKGYPQKLAQALVVLLLIMSGGVVLPPEAHSQENGPSPETIQAWKDYLKNYPAMLAQYNADEAALRQAATVVVASEVKDMDDLVRTYPFLQADLQNMKDAQEKVMDYMNAHPDQTTAQSPDMTPHIQVAESRDAQTGINVLFVGKSGRLWCGSHGCSMDIYVDTGAGYQKVGSFIVHSDIYLARADGQVAVFFAPPQNQNTKEWILKDNKFVINTPPLPDPPSTPQGQDFVTWRQSLERAGQWPPQ